ncbi:cohesin domain-containing protein [Anatilimnocola sp. NA78]|uniref:cohesin domain-containing protein n=1 Tax=Anatilimnocola sp. NA78 TaxID=3415683 RepID=UPI003CE58E8D
MFESLESRDLLAAVAFNDPNPWQYNFFGEHILPLANGNVVITARGDNSGGQSGGAVYLFDGESGEIISTIRGRDFWNIGSGGVLPVGDSNFIIVSPWYGRIGNGQPLGAVTFGNGETGVSGVVDATNSLVGSKAGDYVGTSNYQPQVTTLPNGNYVVMSPYWSGGGALTVGDGQTGTTGAVSADNSLVGAGSSGFLSDLTILANGNLVVNGYTSATWINGATGLQGTVTANNSLVGLPSRADAANNRHIVEVGDSNYVVATNRSVTWGSGSTGMVGQVSVSNSLLTQTGGTGTVTVLENGNYVVASPAAQVAGVAAAGAVTWGNGNAGISGNIGVSNSLVGTQVNDAVGSGGVVALENGNFVVLSPAWDAGTVTDVGAVTWSSSSTSGIKGAVSAANSLTGSTVGDQVGSGGVKELPNGNYVIRSPLWDRSAATNAGAVTWANAAAAITGTVAVSNSLVGNSSNDQIGSGGVTPLVNGNYVVASGQWDSATATDVGAVTWGNGATGSAGVVTAANSLIGSTAEDRIGTSIVPLTNGNYLVYSQEWAFGSVPRAGAVTWRNGTVASAAVVSTTNSLHGSLTEDLSPNYSRVPVQLIALAGGNYVVGAAGWDNGSAMDAGAAIWGNGNMGISGPVSTANSLYGNAAGEYVGMYVTALTNGNYLVSSGADYNYSALTWGNGASGVTGLLSTINSLVGLHGGDSLGYGSYSGQPIVPLPNGNFVFSSWQADVGSWGQAGIAVWGRGDSPLTGQPLVQSANFLLGTRADGNLQDIVLDIVRRRFFAPFIGESVVRIGDFDSGFRVPTPSLAVTLTAGNLVIADVAAGGNRNNLTLSGIKIGNVDYLEIEDPIQQFISAPSTTPASLLLENSTKLRIPLSAIAGSITLDLGSGKDDVTLYSSLDMIPAGGLYLNGGADSDHLLLYLQGTTTINYTGRNAGTLGTAFGLVTFTGIDQLLSSATTNVINLPSSSTNATSFVSGVLTNQILSGENVFTPTSVSNSNLTLLPGTPNDTILIDKPNAGGWLTVNVGNSLLQWKRIRYQTLITSAGVRAHAETIELLGGELYGNDIQLFAGEEIIAAAGVPLHARSFAALSAKRLLTDAARSITLQVDSGNLVITADQLDLRGLSATTTGTIEISPRTAGRPIDLGGVDTATTLGISDAELDQLSAAKLYIGDASSGEISITNSIRLAVSTELKLQSSGAIRFAGGSLNSAGGPILLRPGTQVVPNSSGLDIISGTGTVNFSSTNQFVVDLRGPIADQQYQQLNIEGVIQLTGLELIITGLAPAVSDQFVIVNNDGTDPIVGTFKSLPEGALINVNGLQKRLTYRGGDGNDVVLLNPPDTEPSSGMHVRLPTGLQAMAGADLAIPVRINSNPNSVSTRFLSADLSIYFDAEVLDVSSVTLGNIFGAAASNWSVATQISSLAGRVLISLVGTAPLLGDINGDLVYLNASIKPTAAVGQIALNLANLSKSPVRESQLNQGLAGFSPAPTDQDNDLDVDGLLQVLPGPQSPVPEVPAAVRQGNYLHVTGTSANDRIYVAPLNSQVRVRVNNIIIGDYSTPTQVYINGGGGTDYVYVHPTVSDPPPVILSAGEASEPEYDRRAAPNNKQVLKLSDHSSIVRDLALLELLNEQRSRQFDDEMIAPT